MHLVAGDGKNGFAKGQFGVTVDADYKSSSKNFSILQNLANDHSGVASLNVVGLKDTFSSNAGVQQGTQVVLQSVKSIYGVDSYVSSKDAVPGQTLYPLIGSPLANVMYSTGKNAEAYPVQSKQRRPNRRCLAQAQSISFSSTGLLAEESHHPYPQPRPVGLRVPAKPQH